MPAWQITKKDVRLLIRDRRTVFVLVALPMLFITILGFQAGQLFSEQSKAKKMRVGVVNDDDSALSGKLISEVLNLNALEVVELSDSYKGKEMLADGKIDVLAYIGPHYHERVDELAIEDLFFTEQGRLAGKLQSLDIEVQAGPFLANAAEIVEELVFAFAKQTIAPDVLKSSDSECATKLFLKARRAAAKNQAKPKPSEPSLPGKSRGDIIYQYLVPSYTVMFVFFIVTFMARNLIAERDSGTLNRLFIAPITRQGLMVGKTLPFLLISVVQTIILFLAGKVLFHMSWGEYPWMLAPVIVSTSLAATALGLLVATVARTDSQVSAYANLLVLTLAGVSGCLMPRVWQPEFMQQVGLVTPHAWALIAYEQLLNRDVPNLHIVWECCETLIGFAAGFFGIAWWRFRTLE